MPHSTSSIEIHRALNRTSRRSWTAYAAHRARVMERVEANARGGRIAVLGAGNCNDIDLDRLATWFADIHLVDVDEDALKRAVKRAGKAIAGKITQHRLDLSGVIDVLDTWREQPPSAEVMREIPERASATVASAIGERFDVVLSSLVLSQLVHTAMEVLGVGDPSLRHASLASVVSHLRIALGLLRPSGDAVFVVDTLARPSDVMDRALLARSPTELMLEMEAAGQCLPCTEVSFVTEVLARYAPNATVELSPAWVWRPRPQRSHLVYAIDVRTREVTKEK